MAKSKTLIKLAQVLNTGFPSAFTRCEYDKKTNTLTIERSGRWVTLSPRMDIIDAGGAPSTPPTHPMLENSGFTPTAEESAASYEEENAVSLELDTEEPFEENNL